MFRHVIPAGCAHCLRRSSNRRTYRTVGQINIIGENSAQAANHFTIMKRRKKEGQREQDLNRRTFLKGSSLSTLMMMMGGVAIQAQEKSKEAAAEPEDKPHTGPPVNCAVIGCVVWGREILKTLARLPNAPVVAICDTYAPMLRRSKDSA